MSTLGIGLMGCGNIAESYLLRAPLFANMQVVAVADINQQAANERAEAFKVRALSPEQLLADPDVDIVVNLTIPAAHYAVSRAALLAGKHVYSEKPYVLELEQGRELAAIAAEKNLRLGSSPDTVLGASHQLGRYLIDRGDIGRVTSGICGVMSHGMESWHPNPDFFFIKGGGPILDLGPYYIANLVQLLGPVKRVGALTSMATSTRTITSQPRRGEVIAVQTPTTIHALLEFAQGAVISLIASWDVWQHDMEPMALFGTEGTLHLPDPNFFAGEVRLTRFEEPATVPQWDHPFAVINRSEPWGEVADYRCAGLADMVQAIGQGRPHRCNADFALHVVEIMTGILAAGEQHGFVPMSTGCERFAPLGPDQARALLA